MKKIDDLAWAIKYDKREEVLKIIDNQLTEDPLYLDRIQLGLEKLRLALIDSTHSPFTDPDVVTMLPVKIQNYGVILDFILQNRQDLNNVQKALKSQDAIFAEANASAQQLSKLSMVDFDSKGNVAE